MVGCAPTMFIAESMTARKSILLCMPQRIDPLEFRSYRLLIEGHGVSLYPLDVYGQAYLSHSSPKRRLAEALSSLPSLGKSP
jgi:hypothetical protein